VTSSRRSRRPTPMVGEIPEPRPSCAKADIATAKECRAAVAIGQGHFFDKSAPCMGDATVAPVARPMLTTKCTTGARPPGPPPPERWAPVVFSPALRRRSKLPFGPPQRFFLRTPSAVPGARSVPPNRWNGARHPTGATRSACREKRTRSHVLTSLISWLARALAV
jgi:hypothetical protein